MKGFMDVVLCKYARTVTIHGNSVRIALKNRLFGQEMSPKSPQTQTCLIPLVPAILQKSHSDREHREYLE